MSDDEMEDYGFEYSDDEDEDEDLDADIENQYYNSKGLLADSDLQGALDGFKEVVTMEDEKGEWGFRALKQSIKCLYRLGRYAEVMDKYKELLTYMKSAVTRNYSEKSITKMLDYVSGADDAEFLQSFFETTLRSLEEAKNERLWFKTNLKLCSLYFGRKEFSRMGKILKELHKSCQCEDGSDDQKKGTQLLEVYAIEIQMYTENKDNKRLKQLYQRALTIKSAIAHPKIMGIIRECGGKMHLAERQWEAAATDFFEAFKSYDEAGVQRRTGQGRQQGRRIIAMEGMDGEDMLDLDEDAPGQQRKGRKKFAGGSLEDDDGKNCPALAKENGMPKDLFKSDKEKGRRESTTGKKSGGFFSKLRRMSSAKPQEVPL